MSITSTTLIDLVDSFPIERGGETALIFLDNQGQEYRQYTFESLKQQCRFVAQNLCLFSDKKEVILIAVEDQAQFVSAFFGCLLAGKIPAPIPSIQLRNNRPGWGRVLNILNNRQADALLAPESQYAEISKRLEAQQLSHIRVYTMESLERPTTLERPLPNIQASDIAYIQYTSGSTALPKGIMLTHAQVLNNLAKMYRVFNREERVKVVGWIPFYHDMGLVGHLFTVLYESGLGAFLPPAAFLANPVLWLKTIRKYGANSAAAPNFAFEHCTRKISDFDQVDLSKWTNVYVGSETVQVAVLNQFAEKFALQGFNRNAFKPVYGLAETTLLAAGGHFGLSDLDQAILERPVGPRTTRTLMPYSLDAETTITIHEPASGQLISDGGEGEIWIESNSNFVGYLVNSDSLNHQSAALVKTGDIGFIQDNFLYITGRQKDNLIVRGVNYAAEDLEHCVRAHQSLLRTNDYTVCAPVLGDKELFYVFQETRRDLSNSDFETITGLIQANLSENFGIQADAVVLILQGTLPKTGNHKIARSQCVEQYLAGTLNLLFSTDSSNYQTRASGDKQDDPVVIVGMACRFPGGADTLERYWELLENGVDAITEVPEDRWDNTLFYDENPAVPGKTNTKWAGFVDAVDQFDPKLFGISTVEAPEIDPQQRLVMETSWRLLENTGWKKESIKGSDTGVFVGISTNDYLYMKIKLVPGMESYNAYTGLGNAHSIAANRVSYFYDLKGPSMAVDTACSSSLTAFHLGVQAILNGECSQAIVGGVNVMLTPGPTITLSQFGMMAPDGRCKTFDASANGYVRSEGCGLVMLKRKSDAERDGDRILATIRATAAAQDGLSPGITFPNGAAQYRLIRKVLDKANLHGKEISYVETHGTGTVSGDPVEMEQVRKLYGLEGNTDCYVGSVKANIGHLEAGAGIASVIKAVLMLQKKMIPPQIHVNNLNPNINLSHSRLKIASKPHPWPDHAGGRKIAVSSFGFGGSLAHAILEETPNSTASFNPIAEHHQFVTFPLSAYSQENLTIQAQNWLDWLDAKPQISLPDICSTLASGRSVLNHRLCLLVDSKQLLQKKLAEFVQFNQTHKAPPPQSKLCFLFTGQGEHYIFMGKALYQRFPIFKTAFDRCVNSLQYEDPAFSLTNIAFESTDFNDWKDQYLQPILFAVQYALGNLYMEHGLMPEVLLGHSLGEYAAACLAGCMEPEAAMQILKKRGELVEALPQRGQMATIFTQHSEIEKILNLEKAQIAAINSPKKTVISGDPFEVMRVCNHFKETEGVEHYFLKTHQAYHSHFMDPMMDEFRAFLRTFQFQQPTQKWLSSVTGDWVSEAVDAEYWVNHLRNTVLFADAAAKLPVEDQLFHFVEIGPGGSTLVAIHDSLPLKGSLLLKSIAQKKADRTEIFYFLDTLCKLFEAGCKMDWAPTLGNKKFPADIPGHQFIHLVYRAKGLSADNMSAFAHDYYGTLPNGKPIVQHAGKDPEPKSTEDSLRYSLEWAPYGKVPDVNLDEALSDNVNWIIVGPANPLIQSLLQQIRKHQKSVFWMGLQTANQADKPDIVLSDYPDKAELFKQLDRVINHHAKQKVTDFKLLFVCPRDTAFGAEVGALNQIVQNTLGVFIALIQALKESVTPMPIWIITEDAQSIDPAKYASLNLGAAPVWGFAKTLYLEHPEYRGGLLDVDHLAPTQQNASAILQKIIRPQNELCVLLRDGLQYIEQIKSIPLIPVQKPVQFRSDGAYIVTGGLGGLGLETAAWLVQKGVRHLVLISRKSLPDAENWDSLPENHPQIGIIQKIKSFRDQGVQIELAAQDIRDQNALKQIFGDLDKRGIPVRGVLHAAGVNWFSKIIDLDREELLETLKTKVAASWMLHQLTKDRDLDCFILYSSVSALWGSVELSHYTAANYFMDMLSRYRSAAGLPVISIDWGPWDEVGMSAVSNVGQVLNKMGFHLMPPSKAFEALEQALETREHLLIIGKIDWPTFKPFIDFSLRPSLFSKVVGNLPVATFNSSEGLTKILQAEPDQARQLIEEVVRMELRRVMLMESMDKIDDQHRFNFLGMDSLTAISFVVEIEQYFNIKLPSTLPYNYPHIRAVTDYLFELVYTQHPVQAPKTVENKEIQVENKEIHDKSPDCWFQVLKPSDQPFAKIFFFPFAGSGVSAYNSWAAEFPDDVELIGIQPPGREDRADEKPFLSMTELIGNLTEVFDPPSVPYYFYGHSWGASLAYACYVALKKAGKPLPEKLLLSGCGALLKPSEKWIHQLPSDEFIEAVITNFENTRNIGQRAAAISASQTLIRADLQVMETYMPELEKIDIPLIVLGGLHDKIAPPTAIRDWVQLANQDISIHFCDAGHDLTHACQDKIIGLIRQSVMTQPAPAIY